MGAEDHTEGNWRSCRYFPQLKDPAKHYSLNELIEQSFGPIRSHCASDYRFIFAVKALEDAVRDSANDADKRATLLPATAEEYQARIEKLEEDCETYPLPDLTALRTAVDGEGELDHGWLTRLHASSEDRVAMAQKHLLSLLSDPKTTDRVDYAQSAKVVYDFTVKLAKNIENEPVQDVVR